MPPTFVGFKLGSLTLACKKRALPSPLNYHLAGSVEPAFCMRASASLNLSPRQWAIAQSPQCRRVSAETGGKSEKQSKSRGAAEGRQKDSFHSMRRNLHVRREERPAGVVKNSRCSLRRMRCAYCEDCAKAQNEELALLVEWFSRLRG